MEKLFNIKIEIEEKKGRDFRGLSQATEKMLETLCFYLDHPKIPENPKIIQDLQKIYTTAKNSGFIKMDGLKNMLTKLNVKFGDAISIQKKGGSEFINTSQEIKRYRAKLDEFMQTVSYKSLPLGALDAIENFRNCLNHPKLQETPRLFEEMVNTYKAAENEDFIKMQTFKAVLTKADIKLGPVPIAEEVEEIVEDVEEIIEGPLICIKCNNESRNGAKFCDNCGASLINLEELPGDPSFCKRCGNENRIEANFCDLCGTTLKAIEEETKAEDVVVFNDVPQEESASVEETEIIEESPVGEQVEEGSVAKEETEIVEQSPPPPPPTGPPPPPPPTGPPQHPKEDGVSEEEPSQEE